MRLCAGTRYKDAEIRVRILPTGLQSTQRQADMTTQHPSNIPPQEPDDEQVVRLDIIDLAEPDEEY